MVNKLNFFFDFYKYFDSKKYYFMYYKIGCRKNKISFQRWSATNYPKIKNKQKFLVSYRNTPQETKNILKIYLNQYPDRL